MSTCPSLVRGVEGDGERGSEREGGREGGREGEKGREILPVVGENGEGRGEEEEGGWAESDGRKDGRTDGRR